MSTIKEVAELARVSIGTVSHVISGSVPVSDPLRRRVLAAIRELDYHPNHIARSLKTSKTRILGMVVPDLSIPFFPKLISGAEAAASKHGYFVMAVSSNDDANRQKEVTSLLRSQRVEGVLLVLAAGQGSRMQVPKLVESGIPLVCLDRLPGGIDVDSVCVEDCSAADMGVSHLVSAGHRDIAILTGPLTLKNEQERLNGYRCALERAGIPASDLLIWEAGFDQEEITRLCQKRLLTTAPRPTALFSTNGVAGLGALRAILECGWTVPEDIAFATIDELTTGNLFRPGITTVVQPAFEIGFRAAEILVDRIANGSAGQPRKAIRLPAKLEIRESSQRTLRAGSSQQAATRLA